MPSLINLLKDVDVQAISLVPGGANGQRIFLFKCDGFECATTTDLGDGRIVKDAGDDWSAFYVVVAEPGTEEKPGLHGDQSTRDVWADEDEIRKAAHKFMRNGGLINKLHQDLSPYGQLVENAIAHQDFTVDNATIKKGSWYIAVEPTEEGRRLINDGELGGVSIQGLGQRVPMEKDAALVPNKPGVTNWVERAGGLPHYIGDIAGDLISERGKSTSEAIQLAVGIVQRWCRGEGDVSAATRAKSCDALAEWEAKRASAHVQKEDLAPAMDEDTWSWANSGMIEKMESGTLTRLVAKALGIDPDACDCGCDDFVVNDNLIEKSDGLIEKAALDAKGRKSLPKSAFVFPGKAPGPGSYPIHDAAHAANAIARSKGKSEAPAVQSAVCKRHPNLPFCKKSPMAKDEGSLGNDGTVKPTHQEDEVELADRVEQIEKTQKEQSEKLDALTAEDSPIMKGIQDLRIKFDERESKPDAEKDNEGDKAKTTSEKDGPITKTEGEKLTKQLSDVADAQGAIAEGLIVINKRLESTLEGQSTQTDPPEQKPIAKSNPLAGLLS